MTAHPKIACPYCDGSTSRVTDSRPSRRQDGIWRRRECTRCRNRFTTEEVLRGTYPARRDPSALETT